LDAAVAACPRIQCSNDVEDEEFRLHGEVMQTTSRES
jgi:hypothetical protein